MIIDRIEGSIAVVEISKNEFRDVPLEKINGKARDGAVLVENNGTYTVDEAATTERANVMAQKRRKLFRK